MAKTEQAVENGTSSSLIENLGKAILELEARKADSEEKLQWKEIEEHFHTLETILKKKFEELEDREKEYEMKESETLELLAEREAAVAAKEQDLLDRVQELKDVAVAAIEEAQANYQPMSLEPLDGGNSKVLLSPSLIVTYLKEIRRKSQGKGAKSGDGASSLQIDVNAQELAALKAVIRCVEQYKLEADYPLDPLHVRKNQLEKSKFDKKRNIVDSDKHPHSKRSRGNGVSRGFRAPGSSGSTSIGRHGPSVYSQRAQYVGMPETYAAAPNPYGYQVSVQTQYAQQANDQAAAAAAALQQYYTQDDRIPSSSSNYGTYMVGNGLQPTHQPYM